MEGVGMSEVFGGTVEVQNDGATTTVVRDGNAGVVTAGGNGSSGKISVQNDSGLERARIAGTTGAYFVTNGVGQDLIEIGGLDGALVVRQAQGETFPEVLTFKQDTASLTFGTESTAGTMTIRDHHGHDTITLVSAVPTVTVRADIGGTL